MNIILVDDDEIIRQGMKKIITNSGHDWNVVAEAGDGEAALQVLDEHPETELLITDIRMPIMDGIELIKEIRKTNTSLRIIVLSGFDDFSYVHSAFINGALDYLLKPFQKQELLDRIESVENSICEERKSKQYDKERKTIIITDVMKRILNGNGEQIPQDLKELEILGINSSFPCFFVCIICADQYYKQFKDVGQYEKRLKDDIDRVVGRLKEKNGFDYCYHIDKQEIAVIVFCEDTDKGEEAGDAIFDVLNNDRDELDTNTIGFSNFHEDVNQMKAAYNEAKDAIQARFYLGKSKKIHYNEISEKYLEFQYDVEPIVNQIIHYLELCDVIKVKNEVEQLFLDLSYSRPDKFRKYILNVLEILIIRIRNFENVLQMQVQDWQFQVEYVNTYRELKTFMNSVLQGVIEYIKDEKSKKSKKRIELAKVFIEDNYRKQITLNDVAEYVELNSSYFSNLFKEEEGINFSEYLLNVRMEKAKKLLKDPKVKVYEIGNLVGYEDAVSFGRAFKKKIGMSPKEYRNSVY